VPGAPGGTTTKGPTSRPEGTGNRDLPRLGIWVALGGIVLSALLSYVVWDRSVAIASANLDDAGDLLSESVTHTVEEIGEQLVAVAGLYHSSEEVSRIEFTRFVDNLGVDPGVTGIAYAPIIETDEIAAFEESVRNVVPAYSVFEFSPQGERMSPTPRPYHAPLQWSHPDTPFDGPYGFDLASQPGLASAVEQSIGAGSLASTPFMQLPGEPDADSFVVFWPVTRVGTPNVLGVAFALVDVSEFLAFKLSPALTDSVTWEVFDAGSELEMPENWRTESFPVLGQEWQLAVAGIDGEPTTPDRWAAVLVLCAGTVISLAAALLASALRERASARREVGRLTELGLAKDQFLASVSHELRTPLTGVVGFTALLRDPTREMSDVDRSRMIDNIADEAGDLAAIIDDLLVAARSELDMVTVTAEPVELPELVSAVVASSRDEVAARIAISPGPAAYPLAMGDPARVRQVVRNLISNACRYGGEPIEVRFQTTADRAVIQVIDHGTGLPMSEWDRIFETYYRVHHVETQPAALGIGLSVSRHLSRLMGGDLAYRYEEGRSIFELSLPQAGADAIAKGRRTSRSAGIR
jgi:signal transduction histidine kinase